MDEKQPRPTSAVCARAQLQAAAPGCADQISAPIAHNVGGEIVEPPSTTMISRPLASARASRQDPSVGAALRVGTMTGRSSKLPGLIPAVTWRYSWRRRAPPQNLAVGMVELHGSKRLRGEDPSSNWGS